VPRHEARASWTLVQHVSNTSCARNSSTCAVTVGATGSGNVLIAVVLDTIVVPPIASISGAGTWNLCPASACFSGANTAIDAAYNLNSTGGITSITVTLNGSGCTAGGCHWTTEILEYSMSAGSTASYDTANAPGSFPSGTTTFWPGVTTTLTGTNDVIVQYIDRQAAVTAISGSYTDPADFLASKYGVAGAINTSSGASPTWTAASGSGGSSAGAIAISENTPAILTQRAFIFENDSGPAVDQNSTSTNGTLQAEKGQRFIVRFQVDNTGTAGSTTTQYAVQFDHNNDGVFNTVTSGEISTSLGISGGDGDSIASNKVGSCQGATSFTGGEWHEGTAFSTASSTVIGKCKELAWVFSTATAVPATTYRLRLYNNTGGQVLQGYTATPTITIVSSQTKIDSKSGAGAQLASAPTDSADLTYYLDATGYAAIAADDNVYDTATSTAGKVPVGLFKLKNPNGNSTDQATLTWNGQTNVSSQVDLEIWNGSSWENVQSNASPSVNIDFTLTGAKTGSAYYDSNFFIYVRVKQAAGAETLRSDLVSASFSAPAAGSAVLTQRAFILENDNGTTADTNTQRGTGIAYPVEQGERFIVRFQVDNTGVGATTANFTVQYDHNDGVWKSVTAGEVSTQLGISGGNGDALTTNKAGSCQGGTSFVNGTYHEGTATTNSFTLTNGNCTEFGFIFSTATAVPRTTYNFRLVNGTNGNQVFQNSVATPSIVLITLKEKDYSKTGLGAELAAAPTNASDLGYWLDYTGYTAIIKNDEVYDTATSSGAGNVPVSLFKIRNYNENTTDSFTVTWTGHSNVAPSSKNLSLDLWDNTHSAWITASTNTFTAAGTDFTFSSATSGSLFYDANYFVYVRVRQAAGVEALSTDQVTIGFGNTSPGFQVDRDDTLSDSRPGVSANQTISFTITMSIDASERLELTWPLAFAFPPDLDCGDVDVATGTQFTLSNTSTVCAATATTWGVEFMSDTRVFRLTAPSTAGTYVATGTKITITIGTNAGFQQTGTTQIVNPASTGIYTVSVGGNFAGIGNMLVSINLGVDVSATIAENLSLTVSSVAAVNCLADDGATVTGIGTSPTSVPFGIVSLNTFYIGCQDLVVSTNAGNGYSLTTQESSAMMTANGAFIIPDTTCDAGTCSESAAGAWTNAAKNGLGHTCANQVNHDCSSAYSSGTNFRQFATVAGGETAQAVMSSSTNATATGRIKFRLSAGAAQAAGTYTTLITYIITATY
jgi:hypothetical protein